MKNSEKYERTEDALAAWSASGRLEGQDFRAWAESEYDDEWVWGGWKKTLLDASTCAVHYLDSIQLDTTGRGIYNDLTAAVQNESNRRKTNFERFKCPKDAYEEFQRLCNSTRCTECRIGEKQAMCDTANFSYSCVAEWLYSTEPELRR